MRTDTKMITFETIAVVGTVGTTSATYLILALAETMSSFEIGVVEKFGGAGLAGILAYLLIRWLFKRNDDLQKKLEELHQSRIEEQKKHFTELIDEIKKKEQNSDR